MAIPPLASRRWLRLRLWLAPAALLLGLWLPGFWQGAFRVDTGLYAAISLHAYEGGALFPLSAGDLPYWNKPPIAFWIHGVFLWALGPELWVARLPSLLAAVLGVYVLAACVREGAPRRRAWASASILALTLEYFRYTKAISLDLWLTVFLLASVWCVLSGVRRQRPWRILLSGVPLGLALLTKPLVGLVIVPIIALWLLWSGRARWLAWLGGAVLAALAVAAPWHIAMEVRFPGQFLAHYFGAQSAARALGDGFESQPWWYYGRLLLETYWPWLPLCALGVWTVLLLRGPLSARERSLGVLAIVWTIAWLVGLSAFGGKSGRYAVVLYPALAILCALALSGRWPRWAIIGRRALTRWAAPAVLIVGIALAALQVKVHGPAPAHWDVLYQFVRERRAAGDDVWTRPDMLWNAANLRLETGAWPRFVGPSGTPPVGAWIIYRDGRESGTPPGPNETEAWRSEPMFATRVTAPVATP